MLSESDARRIRFVTHKGRRILRVDCSRAPPALLLELIRATRETIAAQPPHSVLTLVDIEHVQLGEGVLHELQRAATANRPFVVGSAVIGLTGLGRAILNTMRVLTQRDFRAFPDEAAAKDWLVGLGSGPG